jgi:Bacterial Ig-like domain (group 1)
LTVKVKDSFGYGVPGVLVTFSDGGVGGILSPASATTNSRGFASTSYTAGTKSGTVTITASVSGLTPVVFKENVLGGPAVSLAIYSGNNQTVAPGTATAKLLQVILEDQYGNPVNGVAVTYSDGGAGGSFSVDPATTGPKGIAGTRYTAPQQTGVVTITASASGLTPVNFTVTVQ